MKKTFIIAEAGSNHNRDKEKALQLIDKAVEAGVDAVKFQTFKSEEIYSKYTPNFAGYDNLPELMKSLELPREWQKELKERCNASGVEFLSTPCDEAAVEELCNLGMKKIKIPGFEATDARWVRYVASTGLPLIISLGSGANLKDVDKIMENISREKNASSDITFLHCNNAYPTPYEDINLGSFLKLKEYCEKNDIKTGISDHTLGILVPPIAVAMGATVVEKHYTLDKKLPGPDHYFAIEPHELKSMVENIRIAEKVSGIKEGNYSESEKVFEKARRSVVINGGIKKGEKITLDNVTTKRPLLENSISAERFYDIMGKTVKNDLGHDMILLEEHLEENNV